MKALLPAFSARQICWFGLGLCFLPLHAQSLTEVNSIADPSEDSRTVVHSVRLIDGTGRPPIENATVIVAGRTILEVGPSDSIEIPPDSRQFDGSGMSLLPGLIDAHFHLDEQEDLPPLFLRHGITSVRDPGAWIEAYSGVMQAAPILPRLFLAGPHLDTFPPAYPSDSIIVRDQAETRAAVNRFIDSGASVIKVYFRLPLALIETAVETAHARNVPVTAHLEIVPAVDAIQAGIDGIEHVTSLGTSLIPMQQAEQYRQAVLADNNARRMGRYQMWSEIDLSSSRVRDLLNLMIERNIFLDPNLAVFERRPEGENVTEAHIRGFQKMMNFVGIAHRAGVPIVVGSHSNVPYADKGWAYQREMELLVESGLTPMETILAATSRNARFFRASQRIGTVESGKLADLVLVQGNPLENISSMREVNRVMLNGLWVP